MEFNYAKVYCTQAFPAFNNLSEKSRNIHEKLIPLVGDLLKNKNLDIPLSDEIKSLLSELTTKEIAEMSQASYFVGHWHPYLLDRPVQAKKGELWKISNCGDQVLRNRLAPLPHNIQIHKGKLWVTFSSRDCWLWEEFALATEDNLKVFKTCNLPFGEETLKKSALSLRAVINDLWPDVETVPDNDLYCEYLQLKKEQERKKIVADFERKMRDFEKSKESARKDLDFLLLCNDKGVSTDNVIHYTHTDEFCFGWRTPLSEREKESIKAVFASFEHSYNITYK